MNQLFHQLPDLENDLIFQFMLRRQHFYPLGNIELDFADRKFIENTFQYPGNVLFSELLAVCRYHCHPILLLEFPCHTESFFTVRHLGIQKDQKRLSLLFQFFYRFLFRLQKIFSGNLSKTAVCSNHKPYGGMFPDHLSCADLGGLMEGNGVFKPWRFHHSFFSFLYMAGSVLYQKPHAVD